MTRLREGHVSINGIQLGFLAFYLGALVSLSNAKDQHPEIPSAVGTFIPLLVDFGAFMVAGEESGF